MHQEALAMKYRFTNLSPNARLGILCRRVHNNRDFNSIPTRQCNPLVTGTEWGANNKEVNVPFLRGQRGDPNFGDRRLWL